MHREELRSVLGKLPIAALGLGAKVSTGLAKAGLRSLRDLWRLPREGLARRYGTGLLEIMDRAAGRTADAPRLYHSPPRFGACLELPLETDNLSHYFPAIEHLMQRLAVFLRSQDAAVADLRLMLHHGRGDPSAIRLELRRVSRDESHLLELLREKLERFPLPEPVRSVGLYAENIHPHVPQMLDVFGSRGDGERAGEWQRLIETLQARLGRGAVRMLSAPPDHRPEQASTLSDSLHSSSEMPGSLRPLWLLPTPRPAALDMKFLSGTERIESGWWDGQSVRRDYRMAIDRCGARLWVYRELSHPKRWYLHGLFG
jgi:protein ImuB